MKLNHSYEEDTTLIDTFILKLENLVRDSNTKWASQDNRGHKDIFIEQYRICIWALSDFFKFVPNGDWIYDGIWSCNIPEVHSEMWLDGPFVQDILKLRSALRPKIGSIHQACTFHKRWIWCILWDLKSPLCAAFEEGDAPKIYDEYEMRKLLNIIQYAWGKPENMFQDTDPSVNRKVVTLFLEKVKIYTLALKK